MRLDLTALAVQSFATHHTPGAAASIHPTSPYECGQTQEGCPVDTNACATETTGPCLTSFC